MPLRMIYWRKCEAFSFKVNPKGCQSGVFLKKENSSCQISHYKISISPRPILNSDAEMTFEDLHFMHKIVLYAGAYVDIADTSIKLYF